MKKIDRANREVHSNKGTVVEYDKLVLATGSYPWVPPIAGSQHHECFVYRTIEDLEAIRDWGAGAKCAAVIGGGLLGLEAAKALGEMQLETHVVEFADRLMPRQVDPAGGDLLARSIEALGVSIHLNARTERIMGSEAVAGLAFALCLHIEDPAAFVAACDVLASPRIAGINTPLKLYSYLRSGRPIVATDLHTHTQVLDPGSALLVAPEPKAFAEGLGWLIDRPDERERFASAAADLAARKYSRAIYLARTREAYARLLGTDVYQDGSAGVTGPAVGGASAP